MIPSNSVRKLLKSKGIEWQAGNDEFYGFFYDNSWRTLIHVNGKYYVDKETGLEQLRFKLETSDGKEHIPFSDYLTLDQLVDSMENQDLNGEPMVPVAPEHETLEIKVMITALVRVNAVNLLTDYKDEYRGAVTDIRDTAGALLCEMLSDALSDAQAEQFYEYVQIDTNFV